MSTGSIEDSFSRYRDLGDTGALRRVFDHSAPELLVLARHLAPSGSEPEDLVQATFLTAMESAASFEANRALVPWLAGILANHARKALRCRLTATATDRPDASPQVDPQRRAESAELQETLRRSLDGIPEPYRPVLSLQLLHGLSPAEIAQTLGRTRTTVRSQIHRGLEILRRGLPAGLAGSLAVVGSPTRSLAAVRREVLAAAGKGSLGSSGILTLLGGILSMKKTAAVTALGLAAILTLWIGWDQEPPEQAPPVSRYPEAGALVATPDQPSQVTAPISPVSRQAIAALSETGSGSGSLLVRVEHQVGDAPVPGRWIALVRADTPDGNRYFPMRQSRTDEDGTVLFSDLEPAVYELRPVLVPGGRPTVRVEAGEQARYTFSISSGIHVEGRVVDVDGHPVPGASIYLDMGWINEQWPVALADIRGRFEIPDVPEHYRVGAMADGFAPSHHHPVQGSADGRETLTIVMQRPAATLNGLILDPEGMPVPQGFVAIQPMDLGSPYRDDEGRSWSPAQIYVLRADDHGAFSTHRIPAEPVLVVAGSTTNLELVHAMEELHLSPGDERYIELRTRRGGTIEGTVTRGGRPVPGLEVGASLESRGSDLEDPHFLASQFDVSSSFTGLRGEYRVIGLREGTYRMYAEGLDPEGVSPVRISWEETVKQDLSLELKARLLLRLVDAAGDPLPGWQITVHYRSVWPGELTDALGEVRFEDFEEGEYTVLVQPPSDRSESHHVYAALGVEDLAAGETLHTIPVPMESMPTARVRGRILDREGRVPLGAELGMDATVLHLPQWGSVPTDERGFVDSGLLPPGTYQLTVRARDHDSLRLGKMVLHPNEVLELGEIRIEE